MAVENYKFYHLLALCVAFLRCLFVHHSILKVYIFNTIFTPVQDSSNLRCPPTPIEHGSQEKMYLLKSTSTPKNKMCTKKYILLLISYI